MIRDTSIEAYNAIRENGLLSERRWQVYDVLYKYGPLTGNEIFDYLKKEYGVFAGNAPSIVSRCGELRSFGCVVEFEKRPCSKTGMRSISWDVTSKLPIKLEKPKRIKCQHCKGKGHIETQQARLF